MAYDAEPSDLESHSPPLHKCCCGALLAGLALGAAPAHGAERAADLPEFDFSACPTVDELPAGADPGPGAARSCTPWGIYAWAPSTSRSPKL
ncbi:hypothetical protein NKH18_12925 [Streptomyces sp. M10(2022)]